MTTSMPHPEGDTTRSCTQADTCSAAELVWGEAQAEAFRDLARAAVGRDCLCEPGKTCFLAEAALRALSPRPHCPTWCTRSPEFHAAEATDPQGSWFAHSGPVIEGDGWSLSVSSIEGFDPADSEPAAVMVEVMPYMPMTAAEAEAFGAKLIAAAGRIGAELVGN